MFCRIIFVLVRNYVLMRFQHSTSTGGEQETVYKDLWRPMETGLNDSMPEFLRHYSMRHGRNVRKGDIYNASKAEFEKLKDASEVREKLKDMKLAARGYAKFLIPEDEGNSRVAKGFSAMIELDSTVFYPLLLRLYRGWEREIYTIDELVKSLEHLESFYVRRLVCGVPTNALNKITMELCLNLPEADVADWLNTRLGTGSGGRRWPSDQEFVEALIGRPLYPRRRIARYMLISLEESFKHKEAVDTSGATIEHIMPQTLTEPWENALGEDYAQVHEKWLDTIGNLTLTGYNSELGNAPFEEKKAQLQNTHFEMSKGLLDKDKWDAEEIKKRGQALSLIAVERWKR